MRMGSFEAYVESLSGNRDQDELFLATTYDLTGASTALRARLLAELKRHMQSLEGSRIGRRLMLGVDPPRQLIAHLKSECDRTFPHIIACACEPEALAITLPQRTAARGSYAEAR